MTTIKTEELIDKTQLRELCKQDNSSILLMAFDFTIILVVATLSEMFWHPITYVIALILIAVRQNGISSVILHDGAHRSILKKLSSNDRFSKLSSIPFVPVISNFDVYRKEHFNWTLD